MKKNRMYRTIAAAGILTLSAGLMSGCGTNGDIGKDEAQQIALEDAGAVEDEITRLLVSQDTDDGRKTYDVQFDWNSTEYEYEILASDGTIRSVNTDYHRESAAAGAAGTETTVAEVRAEQPAEAGMEGNSSGTSTGAAAVAISEADAKTAALERVPGAAERDLRMKLDFDDGRYVYEGDIIYDQKEYEFEIDANTGTFLEWSEERL